MNFKNKINSNLFSPSIKKRIKLIRERNPHYNIT